MNKLNLQQIQGNGADEIASTGFELVRAFNGNFTQVKEAIENLDNRLFHDLSIAAMAELDNLRSGSYRIILTVAGGVEYSYLLCTIDPDGKTIRQTRVADKIYTRTYAGSVWDKWEYTAEYVSGGKIDITQGFSVLDEYNSPSKCGWYVLTSFNRPAYHLLVTSDNMNHVITQFVYGNSVINEDGEIKSHQDNKTTILIRTYNISAPNLPDIPVRTWGKWRYLQDTFLKSEFGASVTDAITQKFFTDAVQNVVSGRIDIGNGMSVLDEYNSPAKCGWYVLMRMDRPAYHLLVTSDDMSHVITQFLYGNSVINENGEIKAHQDYSTTILTRTYNINAPILPDIPARTWGKWRYEYESHMVDLPESEYVKLRDAGKVDKNVYYFTYEDEV